ncbi:MAG: S41 family peptidase [Crocinitomicaceae bacterium]|nr:S41 family peptidase [Crocinitomicaceae bacterium]
MNNFRIYVFTPLLVFAALGLGYMMGNFSMEKTVVSNEAKETADKVSSIIDFIEENYVDTVDVQDLTDRSIHDILQNLDPHSSYIPASRLKEVNESMRGNFGGVGIRFLIHNDTLVATHVLPHSPAEMAGLKPGDRIIEVDEVDLSTIELTNEYVLENLKGLQGTDVQLKVVRDGEEFETKVTRGTIPISSIDCGIMLSDQVGFIKLSEFSASSYYDFKSAIRDLRRKGMRKLIFDIRGNGGGYLGVATEIIDEFLESDKMIVYTEGRKSPKKSYYSSAKGELKDIELVILIDSYSASASEIVSGACQDNDRGTIMGRRTFGKGLVQDQIELKDGSAMRLTIARYYTPTGRSIQRPYGDSIKYHEDALKRYENGEFYHPDSSIYKNAPKFETPGGKIVYGGGGITPDIFLPFDSTNRSVFITDLRIASAFNHWAFDYMDKNRGKWKSFEEFDRGFQVTEEVYNQFIQYAINKLGVEKDNYGIQHSKRLIKMYLKAEVARHLFTENEFYFIMEREDADVKRAQDYLEKGQVEVLGKVFRKE